MIRFLFLIIAIFFTSSCDRRIARYLPNRPDTQFDLKSFSPEFRKGWEDGCETGMSGGSNTFYKMFYKNNKVDGYLMANNADYQTAWGNAFWFCYRFDYIKQKSSIWGSTFGGYQ